MKVAVIGCEVNGRGEAKDAHLGIAGVIREARDRLEPFHAFLLRLAKPSP